MFSPAHSKTSVKRGTRWPTTRNIKLAGPGDVGPNLERSAER